MTFQRLIKGTASIIKEVEMRIILAFAALILTLGMDAGKAETIGGEKAFSFVALGDVPYNLPSDYNKFDRLIAAINQMNPAFTLHMGDIKSARTSCSDDTFRKAYDQFQTFQGAVVYTIGDNEWVDCHRIAAGSFNPRERLAKVHAIFFATPEKSLGQTPIDIESQSRLMLEYAAYVENTRFVKNDVLFLGVHVPGSNNGFEADNSEAVKEYFDRDKANVSWIDAGFLKARDGGARAIVVFMQAEFDESRLPNGAMPRQSGFLDAIEKGATAFGKPVLLIHGDNHHFSIEPLKNSNGRLIPGVNKLMVYGDTLVHRGPCSGRSRSARRVRIRASHHSGERPRDASR